MSKDPRSLMLSIVLCTHNRANLARDAINSILEQEFSRDAYELLIIDNSSTDDTREMAEGFCRSFSNVRYILEPNIGLSHARNRGWQEAHGDYVGYLDDDCKVPNQWLANASSLAKTIHPDAFGGPYYPFYHVPKPKWYKDEYSSHAQGEISRPLQQGEYLTGGNMFIRRDVLIELDGFNSEFGMSGKKIGYGEETYFFNRLRMKRPTVVLYYDPSMFVYHLVRPEKLTLRGAPTRFFMSGYYYTKLTGFRGQKNGINIFVLVVKSFLSIFWTLIEIFRSCTWKLLARNRKVYPLYQNYLYEKTMPYFSILGSQTQHLLQQIGMVDM